MPHSSRTARETPAALELWRRPLGQSLRLVQSSALRRRVGLRSRAPHQRYSRAPQPTQSLRGNTSSQTMIRAANHLVSSPVSPLAPLTTIPRPFAPRAHRHLARQLATTEALLQIPCRITERAEGLIRPELMTQHTPLELLPETKRHCSPPSKRPESS